MHYQKKLRHSSHTRTRGSALVEMAVLLPVLIVMFIGMVEFGHFVMMRERANKIANQVNASLYQLTTDELANETVINQVLQQVPAIAKPYKNPMINLRFCDYRGNILHRIYNNPVSTLASNPVCSGRTNVPCSGQAHATKDGHGLFVQTTACLGFQPMITEKIFSTFGIDVAIATTAYTPMTDSNQSELILVLPHGEKIISGGPVPESGAAPNPGECPISTCPEGKTLTGTGASCSCTGTCSNTCTQLGQTQTDDCRCVRDDCPPGYSLYNGQCIGWPRDCTEQTNNACVCQPPGQYRNGRCEIDEWCPEGQMLGSDGKCTSECTRECTFPYDLLDEATCTCKYRGCSGNEEFVTTVEHPDGTCVAPCAQGNQQWNEHGVCVDRCPAPHSWVGQRNCVCANGYVNGQDGNCVPPE